MSTPISSAIPVLASGNRDVAAASPSVIRLNPLAADRATWDERLQSFPNAGIFHTADWFATLQQAYGYSPCCFVAREPHRGGAILPLVEIDSWLTGRRAVGLPFTDECPPLVANRKGFEDVFEQACAHGRDRRWRSIEIRGGHPFVAGSPSISYLGHHLDLTTDTAALFAGCSSATRRAVRKAEQQGVVVELSATRVAMQTFHELMCRTRRRHGLPPAPLRFFERLRENLLAQGHGCIALARHQGLPVAGAVFLRYRDHVLYKYGASDERQQQLRANNLVMWLAIQHFARLGFRSLEFGRTSLGNEGLRAFKLGWGAHEYPITYYKYDLRLGRFVTGSDRTAGWHTLLFRHAPTAISRLIGALLYRHMG